MVSANLLSFLYFFVARFTLHALSMYVLLPNGIQKGIKSSSAPKLAQLGVH